MTLFLDIISGRKATATTYDKSLDFPFRDIQKMEFGQKFAVEVLADEGDRFKVRYANVGGMLTSLAKHPLFELPYFYMRRKHNVFQNVDFNKLEFVDREFSSKEGYTLYFEIIASQRPDFDHINRLRLTDLKIFDEKTERFVKIKNDHL